MENKLSCSIIKDLLSIYIDGIASKETNVCIKQHLSECDICKKEYYRMCNVDNSNEKNSEMDTFKKFKLKIILKFISLIIISVACISLSIMCNKIQYGMDIISTKEITLMLVLNIGIYFIPMMALLFCWIWKKASYGSSSYNVSNAFFISLIIIVIYLIINLLYRYINLLKF
ncbi:zf-HC2 domain-containing protein [Clostridium sp. MB05]|jgi:Putative zinc-finger|uniref:Putative zinc-finger domain-containing protein n=1 Tax=Clostridium perfringens TaxID=1502 RepID=A0AAW9K3M2_CLOPF|nr:hypothetical protein [Clostridium perfringens]